jgi:hypothetical protein
MKKTHFPKAEYQVAISLETGCIVMVKSSGGKQSVMGSLGRAESMAFAQSILDWRQSTVLDNDARMVPVEAEQPKLTLVN